MQNTTSKKDHLLQKYNRILFALGVFLLTLHLIKLLFLLTSESIKFSSAFFGLSLLSTLVQLTFNFIFLHGLKNRNGRIYFYAIVLSIMSIVVAVDNLILRIQFRSSLFVILTTVLYIIACLLIFLLSYRVLFIKKNPTV